MVDSMDEVIVFALFIALVTALIASALISGAMTRPIGKLSRQIDEITTKGNLEVKFDKSSTKEIQTLTDSLNRVLTSLKLAILRTGIQKEELGIGAAIKAKEDAEARYRALYETSADAIMTLEPPTWKFTAANPATIKMFNCKDEKEFTSLGPWDVSPERQPDGQLSTVKAQKMIMKAMKEGSNLFKWTHKRYNGADFPATVLLTRFKSSGKDIVQATVRDLSQQKIDETALKRIEALRNIAKGREETAGRREAVAEERETIVGSRESAAKGRETIVGRREKIRAGVGREGIIKGREDAAGKREDIALGRERVVGKRESVAKGREETAGRREAVAEEKKETE